MDKTFSIVAGVDFSNVSRIAIGHAMRIAARPRASLQAVHVIDDLVVEDIADSLGRPDLAELQTALVADAKAEWHEFIKGIPGADAVPFNATIQNKIVGILKEAARYGADLLVLGAAGINGAARSLGTVARACVREPSTDVLLVREAQTMPFRKVVVAVDFSDTSLRAVLVAAKLASIEGASLDVLHVFQPPSQRLHYRALTLEADPSFEREYQQVLRRRLIEFTSDAVGPELKPTANWTIYSNPGHRSGIAAFARESRADLIVLGTRGRTNLRDFLLGSTAEKTLDETECSVLAVKPSGSSHPLSTG